MSNEMTLSRADRAIACSAIAFLIVGLPTLGVTMALITGNPWWLWLIAPLIVLMEGGLFLIAVILAVVWSVMGV